MGRLLLFQVVVGLVDVVFHNHYFGQQVLVFGVVLVDNGICKLPGGLHVFVGQRLPCLVHKRKCGPGVELQGRFHCLVGFILLSGQCVVVGYVNKVVGVKEHRCPRAYRIFVCRQKVFEFIAVEILVVCLHYLFILAHVSLSPTVRLNTSLSGVLSRSGVK